MELIKRWEGEKYENNLQHKLFEQRRSGKIKHDNNDVELIGRDLTPNTPQENLMYSVCLFIISAAVSGPIGNASYDLLKLVWKNFKQKFISWVNYSNKKIPAKSEAVIKYEINITVNIIWDRKPTYIEWLNITDATRHLRNGNYLIKLNEDGRINIWTMQEYGEYQLEHQKKK